MADFDTDATAIVDFTNQTLDRFVFRGKFNGVSQTNDPNQLDITVIVTNNLTNETATWKGHPTVR